MDLDEILPEIVERRRSRMVPSSAVRARSPFWKGECQGCLLRIATKGLINPVLMKFESVSEYFGDSRSGLCRILALGIAQKAMRGAKS